MDNPFTDDFSAAALGADWITSFGGTSFAGAVSVSSNVLGITLAHDAAGTVREGAFPRAGLPVGNKNFVFVVKLVGLSYAAGTNPCAVGVGLGIADSPIALRPLFEITYTSGAATTRRPCASWPNENEIGRIWTDSAENSWPLYVRITRGDDVVSVETSADGSAWTSFGDVELTALHKRYTDEEGSAIEGDTVILYIRQEHTLDSAGLFATFDDVYLCTWDRYAPSPSLSDLKAKTSLSGGQVDLSWTLPDGSDTPRWMRIERSLLAHPETLPADSLRTLTPSPMLALDLSYPAVQWTPDSTTSWASSFPTVTAPTAGWRFTAEGGVYNSIAGGLSAAFTAQGDLSLLDTSAKAVGLYEGGTRSPQDTITVLDDAAGGGWFELDDSAIGDATGQDIAGVLIVRFVRAQGGDLISRFNAARTSGWTLYYNGGAGLEFSITHGGVTCSASLPSSHVDQAWHIIGFRVHWAGNRVMIYSEKDAEWYSTAAMPVNPTFAAVATGVRIGFAEGGTEQPYAQVRALYLWEGAAAEAIGPAQMRTLFTHGQLPVSLPPGFTSNYSVSTPTAGQIHYAADAGFRQDRVGMWAQNAVWYGSSRHTRIVEARFDIQRTNRCPLFDDLAGLTPVSTLITDRQLSPAHTLTAVRLDGDSDGYIPVQSDAFLATNTAYTVSVWVRAASDTVGQMFALWARDYAGTTVDINTQATYYAQPYWRRFSLTFNTGAQTGVLVRMYDNEIGRTGGAVMYWGVQIEEGSFATDPIPTYGGPVTREYPLLQLLGPGLGTAVNKAGGEIVAEVSRLDAAVGLAGVVLDASPLSGGNVDRVILEVTASEETKLTVYDSAGALGVVAASSAVDLTVVHDVRAYYSSTSELEGTNRSGDVFVDGLSVASDTGAYTPGNGVDLITVGMDVSEVYPLCGGIAYLAIWSTTPTYTDDTPRVPYSVGLDPRGEVIYEGLPTASHTDTAVDPFALYYYTVFLSRFPYSSARTPLRTPRMHWLSTANSPGPTEGWASPEANRATGIASRDFVGSEGSFLYNNLPVLYRRSDEEERTATSRAKGLLDSWLDAPSRMLAVLREHIHAIRLIGSAPAGPLGMVGTAISQHSIVEAVLSGYGIDARGIDGLAKRRLWEGVVGVLKRSGSIGAVRTIVELLTGWRSSVVAEPGVGAELRFLRTWDGFSTRTHVDLVDATFGAGYFESPSLALSPDEFVDGLFHDWFGNVKRITGNTATRVTFADATFTPFAERTYTPTVVTGGNTATLPRAVNDAQYNGGMIHEVGLGAAVSITATAGAARSITAAGLSNSAGTTVAVAKAYTGNYAARVPTFSVDLWAGEASWVWDPASDLALIGDADDPFFVVSSGLAPTGVGAGYPVTEDDVIVWAPSGAARHANLPVVMAQSDNVIVRGSCRNARPGDWLSPNRNQPLWWRITYIYQEGADLYRIVCDDGPDHGSVISDVCEIGDLATIVTAATLDHDRAVRSLVPYVLPLNSRIFVYYR